MPIHHSFISNLKKHQFLLYADLILDDNYFENRWLAEFWIGGNNPNAHSINVNLNKFEF